MDTLTTRAIARFKKAVQALVRALELGALPEHADRDAVLLRFELVAELAPKTLKRVLAERGAVPALPKDIVRIAREANIVSEEGATALLAAIDDRNRMVHDYSEHYASELIERVRSEYSKAFNDLAEAL